MPARKAEAVRQRAIAAANRHAGQLAVPTLDPVFVALNSGQLPAPRGPRAEQGLRLRRAEEIETLSYRTVVELNSENRLAPSCGWPPSRAVPNAPSAWPVNGPAAATGASSSAPPALPAPTVSAGRTRSRREERWLLMSADPTGPDPDPAKLGSAPTWSPTWTACQSTGSPSCSASCPAGAPSHYGWVCSWWR
jgi:hypothetical protein